MKFGLVDPKERIYRIVDAADTSEALAMLGIPRDETDHGMVARDIGIIVYEFGLFVLPELQSYFAVGRKMFAGAAVLYGVGPAGETVDFRGVPSDLSIRWLKDQATIEREIAANLLERPRIGLGGKSIWEWPNPNHPFMSMGAEMRKGFQLKRPCRHCPFSPSKGTIVFACRERAEEIEETAYRNGFPCHKSAVDTSDEDPDEGGYVFGENTQHCAGAIMMYLASGESSWPGIGNDDDLGEELSKHLDWKAPHFDDIEEFLEAKGGSK